MHVATATAGSTSIAGAFTASVYRASRAEVTINASAAQIWPLLPGTLEWAGKVADPDVLLKRVSGEAGELNELILVDKKNRPDQSPFYQRTIRVVAPQQRVLRIDALDGSFGAFIDHGLYEHDGRTQVVYNGYIEQRMLSGDGARALCSQEAATAMMEYLNHGFEQLRDVVEGRPQA